MDFELAPGRLIGPDHPVFIIAEIGQNHQGNLQICVRLCTYLINNPRIFNGAIFNLAEEPYIQQKNLLQ